jgi:hypothetical protein
MEAALELTMPRTHSLNGLASHLRSLATTCVRKSIVALLILSPANAFAQQQVASSTDALRKVLDQSMGSLSKGQIKEGYSTLSLYSSLPSADMQVALEDILNQQPGIQRRFGRRLGYQLLRSEGMGDNLIRWTYLERFEKSAITWNFIGYRGKTGWMISGVTWSGDLERLFEGPQQIKE